MSAERTNIDTQAKRHRPSLVGIGAAVGVAAILLLGYLYALTTTDVDEVDALVPATQEESN